MAAPPVIIPVGEDNFCIVVVDDEDEDVDVEKTFPVHHYNGYAFHLRLSKGDARKMRNLTLRVDNLKDVELWKCTAVIKKKFKTFIPQVISKEYIFSSWDAENLEKVIARGSFDGDYFVDVTIKTSDDGNSWRRRPTLDPFLYRDGTLVCGEEKKKIHVNKESLASQSPFFEKLFYSDFKEKDSLEIRIGEVSYEEFSNILKMLYGFHGAKLTDDNVLRVLLLADRFDLKIVQDKAVSYLLSSSSSFSIHQKLLISEQYNLPFAKDVILSTYTKDQLKELSESPEWEQLSKETAHSLFKRSCNL